MEARSFSQRVNVWSPLSFIICTGPESIGCGQIQSSCLIVGVLCKLIVHTAVHQLIERKVLYSYTFFHHVRDEYRQILNYTICMKK